MKEAEAIIQNQSEFLKYLKSKFTLIHLSNVFFRDFHYGVLSYLEEHGMKMKYSQAEEVAREVAEHSMRGLRPGLAVVLVGDDPGSQIYVSGKVKTCEQLGLYSEKIDLPSSTTTAELLSLVRQLNARDEIDGILIQLPLPKHVDAALVLNAVDPAKDERDHPAGGLGREGRIERREETASEELPARGTWRFDQAQFGLCGAEVCLLDPIGLNPDNVGRLQHDGGIHARGGGGNHGRLRCRQCPPT